MVYFSKNRENKSEGLVPTCSVGMEESESEGSMQDGKEIYFLINLWYESDDCV